MNVVPLNYPLCVWIAEETVHWNVPKNYHCRMEQQVEKTSFEKYDKRVGKNEWWR